MSELQLNSLKVKAVLLGISPLIILPSAAISPALPQIQDHFAEVNEYWVRLVLTMPALSIIIGGLLAGQVIDRFGRKAVLIITVILASGFGAMGYALDSLTLLLLTRIGLGLAVACTITSVTTLIADYYDEQTRATLMGWQSTCIGLVGVVVLGISGILADISWRMPFLIYLAPLVLVPFMSWWLQEPSLESIGTDEPTKISLAQLPLLTLAIIYGVELLHMFLYYLTPVQLPFYLRSSFNTSAAASGFALSLLTLCQAAISVGYGWVKARFNFVQILAIAFSLAAVGHAIIAVSPTFEIILAGLALMGLGFGLLFPNSKVWLTQAVAPKIRGRALGGLTTAFYIGEFLSPFASQTTVQWVGASGTYALVSGVLAVTTILALAINHHPSVKLVFSNHQG